MARTKEDNVYFAKLSEQTERYDDMVEYMKRVINTKERLTMEERNLLSVAYKNIIGSRRASWRIINAMDSKVTKSTSADKEMRLKMIANYKKKIESELDEKCRDVLALLENILIKCEDLDTESEVFYLKMKGDYLRYLAEFSDGTTRDEARDESLKAYKKASEVAAEKLSPVHPVRLGLALNFSVFHYEIMAKPEVACTLAKGAFDEALDEMNKVSEDVYKDSTLIMQLLRDNLTLWTSENEGFEEDGLEAN